MIMIGTHDNDNNNDGNSDNDSSGNGKGNDGVCVCVCVLSLPKPGGRPPPPPAPSKILTTRIKTKLYHTITYVNCCVSTRHTLTTKKRRQTDVVACKFPNLWDSG